MITKKIFTFYTEPIPNYIKLCLKTWQKYKPKDYELIFLNKKNINQYIEKTHFSQAQKAIKENNTFLLSLLVINSQGGLYLSPDTIFLPNFSINTKLLEHSDVIFYSLSQNYTHNGFVLGKKKSNTLKNLIKKYKPQNTQNISSYITTKTGFSISDITNELTSNKISILDSEKEKFLIELAEFGVISKQLYEDFYFTNNHTIPNFLKKYNSFFALNKELTPKKYIKMPEKEFLKQGILLSNIFQSVLK